MKNSDIDIKNSVSGYLLKKLDKYLENNKDALDFKKQEVNQYVDSFLYDAMNQGKIDLSQVDSISRSCYRTSDSCFSRSKIRDDYRKIWMNEGTVVNFKSVKEARKAKNIRSSARSSNNYSDRIRKVFDSLKNTELNQNTIKSAIRKEFDFNDLKESHAKLAVIDVITASSEAELELVQEQSNLIAKFYEEQMFENVFSEIYKK